MTHPASLETVRFSGIDCPKCRQRIFAEGSGPLQCPHCGWSGEAHILRPLREKAQGAQEALPDQAVCVHHPGKHAEAVCAGTGDYICPLCAVELEGKIYSAQYLDRAGRGVVEKNYSRYLERPDQSIVIYLLLCVPLPFLAPLFLIMAALKFAAAIKLRRSDKLYAAAVPWHRLGGIVLVCAMVFAVLAWWLYLAATFGSDLSR